VARAAQKTQKMQSELPRDGFVSMRLIMRERGVPEQNMPMVKGTVQHVVSEITPKIGREQWVFGVFGQSTLMIAVNDFVTLDRPAQSPGVFRIDVQGWRWN